MADFKRVLIANRGVVAGRIVRALKTLGIDSVACYCDIDAEAPHLEQAGATARLLGYRAADTYLNAERIIAEARRCGADAIHPGYGFLSENAGFARRVAQAGLTFIGPAPEHIERMGMKPKAREVMREAGFPVGAGSAVVTEETIVDAARELGFPVMLKPAAGGGGIGMRVVHEEGELASAHLEARALAKAAFGDEAIYLEAYLERPRHVEFQMLGDGDTVRGLFERECSVQRRHQKVIEEAPAPGLDRHRLRDMETRAAEALSRIGYENLGTVETLWSGEATGFLEVNARLQVEHGVTEEITGVDLVAAQIRLAAGAKLGEVLPADIECKGHAVEARIYAEDSERMLPSTGRLSVYRPPCLTGVRVEAGYAEGQAVTPYFDPLLAKVIGTGETRARAIGRALVGVKAFDIAGVRTNQALLQRVLTSEAFRVGALHTGLLEDLL